MVWCCDPLEPFAREMEDETLKEEIEDKSASGRGRTSTISLGGGSKRSKQPSQSSRRASNFKIAETREGDEDDANGTELLVAVTLPAGVHEHQTLTVRSPHGNETVTAIVPAGLVTGDTFLVRFPPKVAPAPVAHGVRHETTSLLDSARESPTPVASPQEEPVANISNEPWSAAPADDAKTTASSTKSPKQEPEAEYNDANLQTRSWIERFEQLLLPTPSDKKEDSPSSSNNSHAEPQAFPKQMDPDAEVQATASVVVTEAMVSTAEDKEPQDEETAAAPPVQKEEMEPETHEPTPTPTPAPEQEGPTVETSTPTDVVPETVVVEDVIEAEKELQELEVASVKQLSPAHSHDNNDDDDDDDDDDVNNNNNTNKTELSPTMPQNGTASDFPMDEPVFVSPQQDEEEEEEKAEESGSSNDNKICLVDHDDTMGGRSFNDDDVVKEIYGPNQRMLLTTEPVPTTDGHPRHPEVSFVESMDVPLDEIMPHEAVVQPIVEHVPDDPYSSQHDHHHRHHAAHHHHPYDNYQQQRPEYGSEYDPYSSFAPLDPCEAQQQPPAPQIDPRPTLKFMMVQVPRGMPAGSTIHVEIPGESRTVAAVVPPGVSSFHVAYNPLPGGNKPSEHYYDQLVAPAPVHPTQQAMQQASLQMQQDAAAGNNSNANANANSRQPFVRLAPPPQQAPSRLVHSHASPLGQKLLLVRVPPGATTGSTLHVSVPDEPGRLLAAQVPPGGVSEFHVSYEARPNLESRSMLPPASAYQHFQPPPSQQPSPTSQPRSLRRQPRPEQVPHARRSAQQQHYIPPYDLVQGMQQRPYDPDAAYSNPSIPSLPQGGTEESMRAPGGFYY